MKLCPIHTFLTDNTFPVESGIHGHHPLSIQHGFIIFRVTGLKNQATYGFLAMAFPDEEKTIRPHEAVIPWKVQSKIEEIQSESSFKKPVCLLYEPDQPLTALLVEGFKGGQTFVRVQEDTFSYEYAIMDDKAWAHQLVHHFAAKESLIIADGHHRTAAYFTMRNESERDTGLFCAILSLNQVAVRSYHRKVRINPVFADIFHGLLENLYIIEKCDNQNNVLDGQWLNQGVNGILLYSRSQCKKLKPKRRPLPFRDGSADFLAQFESEVLIPFCERTSLEVHEIVEYVSDSELDLLNLNLHPDEMLFFFPPVSREFLWSSSHRGELLPAKSTWIEPRMPSDVIQIPNPI